LTSRAVVKIALVTLLVLMTLTTAASRNHAATIYFNGGCQICVEYVDKLESALRSIDVTDITRHDYYVDGSVLEVIAKIRERFNVPYEFVGAVTTIVDERYVFEGYFPIDILTNFVASDSNVDRLVAAEGFNPGTYRLRKDNVMLECSVSQKITDCLGSSTLVQSCCFQGL